MSELPVEPTPAIEADSIYIRDVLPSDESELIATNRASRALHAQWISPPVDRVGFQHYLDRIRRSDHIGKIIRRRADHALIGVVNINNIVRGSFLSASLGYYANAELNGRGYMRVGLKRVVEHAFIDLRLHRLEANIQSANLPSIALVKALGFQFEGISPAYLFIDGAWRDHERWTLIDARTSLLP
ncbi:MAG: GNAT family N-acetyltransferase [Pseudomonadaceae bacterium]|nr:GNAT family N-acetyltransferase [Pseudomonadaceae bacterium]